jgi:hypothetical protein
MEKWHKITNQKDPYITIPNSTKILRISHHQLSVLLAKPEYQNDPNRESALPQPHPSPSDLALALRGVNWRGLGIE